ncbi:MAG: AMP-binding protein [Betaproteobacteria bacterium]|nr:AMP-binding protein [Betaproteobacteria bacterium]
MRHFPDPPEATVHEAFQDTARRVPARTFLRILPDVAARYGIAVGDLSYGDALQLVDQLRERYLLLGNMTCMRVGLLLENRPEFFLHWLALNALGVSVVPLSPELRAAELTYLIEHSEMRAAICIPARKESLREAAEQAGIDLLVASPDDLSALPMALAPTVSEANLDTECGLLYTSGTTGTPKGCVLTNRYYLQAGHWYSGLGGLCAIQPDAEVLITPLPMNHMNAMAFSTMVMILNGGCIVPLDRFHPASWWQSVRASGATIIHYLGVMPSILMSAAESSLDRAHSVRFGFGAGVDKRLHAPFEARFGFPLVEAWAMTETGAGGVVIAHTAPRHVGTSCFGRAPDELEYRLVDESGADVAVCTPGELLVRAAGEDPRRGFFREYLKDADATAAAWAGGWFHTGDVVRADEDGNLYFVDRRKNVIRRSGENISAVEVESVLRQYPGVKDVAVAATPDAVRGDEVLACVILKPEAAPGEPLARELVAYSLAQLAYYKAPGWVAFVEALPLTASQKVQRGELKKLAAALPGSANVFDTRAMKKRAVP